MVNGENRALYAAFKAKDSRFDGRFFVGVASTGIYCRPVCRAKLAKIKNCTFYSTAAEAEQAGFRPCLLCRPERAPGTSSVDATASLVRRAARLLEEECGSGQRLEELAGRLGCTDRHLRRTFTAEYHVSPVQYLQTCRLLLAKNLLTDTDLSVLEVAMAAGFGSLRRFNALFKQRYRLNPGALRRQTGRERNFGGTVTLELGYRPPYQWEPLLEFLAQRAIGGVETVSDGEYARTIRLVAADHLPVCGWVRVGQQPKRNALAVTLSSGLLPVLPQVLGRIRQLFDLTCDPVAIYEVLSTMNDIRPGLCLPGIRLPGCFDPFEMSVRAVLGQQITVRAAGTLAARLAERYGVPVPTGIEGLTHVFPSPAEIAALPGPISSHFGPLGIIAARANCILELARAFEQNTIQFGPGTHPEAEIKKLTAIPGIGVWTAHYIGMRAMGWPDAFLHTDYGVKKALAPYTPQEILTRAEAWRPWRSYATVNLWNSL
ncbi:MAG TPA: AlkA N-terminal domain-containing protein [Patescibacteria group bacterium]|nr:AlkA N-terminal domain-containing protein [Patescibacteria group bacterium]